MMCCHGNNYIPLLLFIVVVIIILSYNIINLLLLSFISLFDKVYYYVIDSAHTEVVKLFSKPRIPNNARLSRMRGYYQF